MMRMTWTPMRLLRWTLMGVLLVSVVVLVNQRLTEPYPGLNDFMSRWEGARSYWLDGLNPYGEQASMNIQMRIYGRAALPDEDPGYFAYPFYTLFVVAPLVLVDYAWASAAWLVLLAVCQLGCLLLSLSLFHWRPAPIWLALLCISAVAQYYAARGLLLGQPGLLVAFLELLSLWALVRGHDRLGAAALALSTLKPQMGFLFVPLVLLFALQQRRWRFIVTFGLVFGGLLAASFLLLPSWLSDWLAQLGLYPSYTALGSPVWIVLVYYLGLPGWTESLVMILAILLLLAVWWQALRGHPERFLWAAALTLVVTHCVAPRTATPHYVVFVLPLVFYLAQWARSRMTGRMTVVMVVWLLVPWLHFLMTVIEGFEHPTVYLPAPFLFLMALLLTRRAWFSRGLGVGEVER